MLYFLQYLSRFDIIYANMTVKGSPVPLRRVIEKKRKTAFSSAQIIPVGFLALIAVGTILLLLPFSTAGEGSAPFLTALFTSTTSVCVTGLVTVETATYWSLFGKMVILVLIQLGGLGVVAVTSFLLLLFRKHLSIRDRVLLRDAFSLESITGLVPFLQDVFSGVFVVEGIGAVLYSFSFIPRYGWAKGIWYSVFHSVSAFCNAGLDLIGPDSFAPFLKDYWVLSVTMALIVIGGLGFIVWFDLASFFGRRRTGKRRRLGEHSRLVLLLTGVLIASGAAAVFLFERGNTQSIGGLSLGDQLFQSVFQSITFRTAGFSVIPQQNLSDPSVLLGCLLMFIGGSPMGTAGGVKTVTVFILIANAFSYVRNKDHASAFHRTIPSSLIRKAVVVIFISLTVTVIMSCALTAVEHLPLSDAVYEIFSATATVGLSRDVTSHLSAAGQWIVIASMYLGRIGPISMALFFSMSDTDQGTFRYADGHFYVG